MTEFTIFPAIDLRNGRVVRLKHGDPNQQTNYGDDPVGMAQRWLDAGASWLHIVNLDGAFDETGQENWRVLPKLATLPCFVQFGGGVRTLADINRVLESGVDRVILGTVAIEEPELVKTAVSQFGAGRIVVGIDARDGRVKTRGWQTDTAVTPVALGQQMRDLGVETVVYTDIARDGVLTGVNVEATAELARQTGLQLIASGGVASIDDILACQQHHDDGVVGVITGRAIYDGRIDLSTALRKIRQ